MIRINNRSNKFVLSIILILFASIILISNLQTVNAAIGEVEVKTYTDNDYSDIWLGLSTGGYRLLTPRGETFSFRIFVKNGMNDRALHNLKLYPNDFDFEINSIKPERIDTLKPMEVGIVWVNITIPDNVDFGVYDVSFDLSSDEFPKGVFMLDEELKVVKKINKELYPIYTLVIVGLIVIVFIRKIVINNINKKEYEKRWKRRQKKK